MANAIPFLGIWIKIPASSADYEYNWLRKLYHKVTILN